MKVSNRANEPSAQKRTWLMTKNRLERNCWILIWLLTFFILPTPPANADQILDTGVPDSAYFGTPEFELKNCSGDVSVTLPVFLFSDYFSILNIFQFFWEGNAVCDTVRIFNTGDADTVIRTIVINQGEHRVGGSSFSGSWSICPTNGTELFLHLVFTASIGDSFSILVDSANFNLRNLDEYWFPLFRPLSLTIRAPDNFTISPGDADCSGIVNISDAVYLIAYIFSGGSPPYDLNSGDVDGSCFVTISDVVFIINYIFAGGGSPIPGCVF